MVCSAEPGRYICHLLWRVASPLPATAVVPVTGRSVPANRPIGHLSSLRSSPRRILPLLHLLRVYYHRRHLFGQLLRQEVVGVYKGQVLGAFWTFGHPLIIVGVLIFIFAFVFKIGARTGVDGDYVTYLLTGLIPWLAMNQALGRGPTVVSNQAHLVKQLVFPLEILPATAALASFVQQGVSLLVLIAYLLIRFHTLPWMVVLLPVVLGLQALFLVGVTYVLSSVGVFMRDLKDMVAVFCFLGLYILPIFYPPDLMTGTVKWVLLANPITYFLLCYQDIFYFARFEHPYAWVVIALMSPLLFVGGGQLFTRLKPMFGNAL